jgi:non-ribosomal peptide synthase protein (TIGR01720 family)
LQEQPQPAISFNYLGQFDQVLGSEALFALAPESPGWDQAPENQRVHQLDVVALIVGEQLHLSWQYHSQPQHVASMQQLAASYLPRLQQLLELAQSTLGDRCPYIPEDFPLLPLSQEALEHLWAQVASCAPVLDAGNGLLEDLYALSGMQAGLLFHSQASLESGLYTEQEIFQVEGAFHLEAFVDSWRQLMEVHPILRTSFVGQDVLAQAVWRTVPLPMRVIDATQLSPEEQEDLLHAYYQADRRRGFVREQAPLLRLSVVRLGA